jgi:hypothetical protein
VWFFSSLLFWSLRALNRLSYATSVARLSDFHTAPSCWNRRHVLFIPVWTSRESMVVLYAARHRLPVPLLARWLLGLGIAATLTANMAQGWSHGPVGAAVAAWPAASLVGSYEFLVWLIRTAGTLEQGPPEQDGGNGAGCPAHTGSLPVSRADSRQRSRTELEGPHLTRRPVSQPDARAAATTGERNDDDAAQADAINSQAVAAYRLSVKAGSPLSERKLARMFGRTSRRWARARISQALAEPPPQAAGDPHTTFRGSSDGRREA